MEILEVNSPHLKTGWQSHLVKMGCSQQQPLPTYHLSFYLNDVLVIYNHLYSVGTYFTTADNTLSYSKGERRPYKRLYFRLVMGLCESIYWMSWLLAYATMVVFMSLILVFMAKAIGFFVVSDTRVTFLLVYSISLSLITMAFSLSTMFSKARTIISVFGALLILGSFIIVPMELFQWLPATYSFIYLLSPTRLALAMNVIIHGEGKGKGLNLNKLWSTSFEIDMGDGGSHLSVGTIIFILEVYSILDILTAWYLDNTWPHTKRG